MRSMNTMTLTIALAAAMATASPVNAQERTADQAHRFLASMWTNRYNQIRTDPVINFANESESGASVRAEGSGCMSHFLLTRNGREQAVSVEWEKVGEVKVSPENPAYLTIIGGSAYVRLSFLFASEADASRVLAAMKVLKQSCAEDSLF